MQFIIDTTLNSNDRKALISDKLTLLGMKLYNICQTSRLLSDDKKSQISGSLCIAYMNHLYKDYLNITVKQFGDMSASSKALFNIEISDDDIESVATIAQSISTKNIEESVRG